MAKISVKWDPTNNKAFKEPGILRSPRTFIIIKFGFLYRNLTHVLQFYNSRILHVKFDVIKQGHSNEYTVMNAFKKHFISFRRESGFKMLSKTLKKISLATAFKSIMTLQINFSLFA